MLAFKSRDINQRLLEYGPVPGCGYVYMNFIFVFIVRGNARVRQGKYDSNGWQGSSTNDYFRGKFCSHDNETKSPFYKWILSAVIRKAGWFDGFRNNLYVLRRMRETNSPISRGLFLTFRNTRTKCKIFLQLTEKTQILLPTFLISCCTLSTYQF